MSRLCFLLLGMASIVEAETGKQVAFDTLFHGGAVLQWMAEVRVWGTSSGNEVTLSLDNKVVAKASVNDGTWVAYLPQQPTGWNRVLMAKDSNGVAEVTVSFGAVVLCSGQSNMDMPVDNNGGFGAANGSAESAAAGRYTGKIKFLTTQMKGSKKIWNGTGCSQFSPPSCKNELMWNDVNTDTIKQFSAVCWYTGKALFEKLGGKVPVGLLKGSVGGSPIEFWLPEGHVKNCGGDKPACDNIKYKDSDFYNVYIKPLAPYTIGAVVWDQGERDVHCYAPATNKTAEYPCMERELIKSWRKEFNSTFAFVAVQLPGYIGDCDAPGANKASTYYNCVPGVFNMRLAQEKGTSEDNFSAVVATYDLGCPFGVKTSACPFGSVHNLAKSPIGARVADELLRLVFAHLRLVVEGPRALHATATSASTKTIVTVTFSGGTEPFHLKGTLHCATCCSSGVGDFDASSDGSTWVNATAVQSMALPASIRFTVALPKVTHVRYTANQAFPQCALYNKDGLPALPFAMKVDPDVSIVV